MKNFLIGAIALVIGFLAYFVIKFLVAVFLIAIVGIVAYLVIRKYSYKTVRK